MQIVLSLASHLDFVHLEVILGLDTARHGKVAELLFINKFLDS